MHLRKVFSALLVGATVTLAACADSSTAPSSAIAPSHADFKNGVSGGGGGGGGQVTPPPVEFGPLTGVYVGPKVVSGTGFSWWTISITQVGNTITGTMFYTSPAETPSLAISGSVNGSFISFTEVANRKPKAPNASFRGTVSANLDTLIGSFPSPDAPAAAYVRQ